MLSIVPFKSGDHDWIATETFTFVVRTKWLFYQKKTPEHLRTSEQYFRYSQSISVLQLLLQSHTTCPIYMQPLLKFKMYNFIPPRWNFHIYLPTGSVELAGRYSFWKLQWWHRWDHAGCEVLTLSSCCTITGYPGKRPYSLIGSNLPLSRIRVLSD